MVQSMAPVGLGLFLCSGRGPGEWLTDCTEYVLRVLYKFTGIGATRTRQPCLYLMVFQNLSCGQRTT